MAGQAIIGALRVNLGLNSAAFTKGVKSAGFSMKRLAADAKRVGAIVATGLAAATAGFAAAVLSTSKYADEMGKTAQAVGVSVESLSELRHAADMSGASFGDLQTGMRKLAQTIGDSITTPTSEGAKALTSLGVSVRNSDGTLKNSEQVLGQVADAFSGLEDGALKTDTAMAIFGRSGAALIPMLNQGSEGLIQMGQEARKLGLVISGETFAAAEAFNDNLARMGKAFQGVKLQVTAGVLPAMENLTTNLVRNITETGVLEAVTGSLSNAMNGLAAVISLVFNNLDVLFKLFKLFVAAKLVTYFAAIVGAFLTLARAIRTTGLVMAAFNAVSKISVMKIALIAGALAMATGNFEELEAKISSFASKVAGMLPDSLRETGQSIMDSLSIDTAGAASSLETYLGIQNDVNNSLADTSSLADRLASGSSGGKLSKIADAGTKAATKTKDAWEGLRGTVKKTTDDMVSKMESAGASIGSALSGLIDGSKSWGDVLKSLASQLAQMALNSFNPTSGVGGFVKGILGSLFSFDGGGFTGNGPRTGGVDGKGGFLSVVHPNETVIDHTKQRVAVNNNAPSGANQNVQVTVINNGSGNRVREETRQNSNGIEKRIIIEEVKRDMAQGGFDKQMAGFGNQPVPVSR